MLMTLNKLSDQMIKFWSLTSKGKLATLDQPTDKLLSLAMSADGKYLIIDSADKTVKIWQNGQ
ncbi:MAG: hypothetical protein EWV53_01370 [Microcystis panniformis Mp_MB_F_20051200_S9]|uniref:Uncharacterized protein n=1 Tax=Microcystis panniformis Mp_MB_F_20051200_S9 TaxID=2486223 RepID=A0A552QAJ9_9CHRO|nr:MAG: hypothetical protein EWV43_12865 [Microcystis panniformis Mp_MB_F_20080800_S26D]TRV47863.1 MAG: hypothetical protein EWV87_13310 [Microcystis panniformis Mp_GB_SS_20050300_S99]TRV52678.1 MAG: hypothetical protein EWV42_07530 [Microcystis panniformis Mp_GB_SS_20050300_S99D]TRV57399.1 MAG: hypothetical protein EWV69_16100 [Microcystis panniformis Mp_MB_F_20080800_S26]TRV66238.1 MAG: hypothetical protein EWV53_01370 [Microcystis panniformis Mp_MB_F_20051200_S9]TRV68137.1 MAG: hypothetical